MAPHLDDLIRILQVAIGPVVLISGVGLLILSMTNRMAHLIDRIRSLVRETAADERRQAVLRAQLAVLLKRSRLIRLSLMMFVLSILIDAMMIIALFFVKLYSLDAGLVIAVLFSLSLLCVIAGLVFFIADITINLRALKLETEAVG